MSNGTDKKKVFLIKVPQVEYYEKQKSLSLDVVRTPQVIMPLSLGYLGGFVREYGRDDFEVSLADVNTRALIRVGGKNYSLYLLLEIMESLIKNSDYDVIGISSAFANNVDWVKKAVALAKGFHPNAPVILGGGYPTLFAEESLRSTKAEYACIGEGEDTLLALLNRIFKIKNERFEKLFDSEPTSYAYWQDDIVKIVPRGPYIKDLDLIPHPAWDLLDIDSCNSVFPENTNEIVSITSRGCPFKCIYCSTQLAWGSSHRFRSAENVLDEIDLLYERYNIRHVHFVDDNMTINKERMIQILDGIVERRREDFTWVGSNFDIRTLYNAKDLIKLMGASKMKSAQLAVESGAPDTQKYIRKNLNLEKFKQVYEWFLALDIPVKLLLMIGFPEETEEDIQKTIDLAYELKPHSTQVNIVTAWPETELHERATEGHYLDSDIDISDMDHRKATGFVNVAWDYEKLNRLSYDTAIDINFLNNRDLNDKRYFPRILEKWSHLETELPRQAVIKMCLGYLYNHMDKHDIASKYYRRAYKLLKEEDVYKVYGRYLGWKSSVIEEYNAYAASVENTNII